MVNPGDIPDLYAWWKSNDLSLNENDHVSTWPDNTGPSGLTLSQNINTQRPVFKEDIQNGFPAVRFKSEDEARLVTSANASLSTPHTIILIHSLTEPERQNAVRIGPLSSSGSELEFYGQHQEDTTQLTVQSTSGDRSFIASEQTSTFKDDVHLWAYTMPSEVETDTSFFSDRDELQNGASSDKGDMVPNADDVLSLGGTRTTRSGSTQATGHYNGDVFDFLIYQRSLSSQEVKQVWDYFADRYAIDTQREPKKRGFLHSWFNTETVTLDSEGDVEKWDSKEEVSNTEVRQSDDSKQATLVSGDPDAVSFERQDTMESLLDDVVGLNDREYSIVVLYKSNDESSQKLVEFESSAESASFYSESVNGGEVLRVDEDNQLHTKSKFIPSIDGNFGISVFTVPETDKARLYRNTSLGENQFEDTENRDLFFDDVFGINFGDEQLNANVVEVLLYRKSLTPEDVASLWSYTQKKYLSESATTSIQATATLDDVDSLVYTFQGTSTLRSTASLTASAENVASASTSLNSTSSTLTSSSFSFDSFADLSSVATTFIQSHKNRQFGRGVIQGVASTTLTGERNEGATSSITADATVSDATVTQVFGESLSLVGVANLPPIVEIVEAESSIDAFSSVSGTGGMIFPQTLSLTATTSTSLLGVRATETTSTITTDSTTTGSGTKAIGGTSTINSTSSVTGSVAVGEQFEGQSTLTSTSSVSASSEVSPTLSATSILSSNATVSVASSDVVVQSVSYKGLAPAEQETTWMAVREDSLVSSTGATDGYPPRPDEIGKPPDNQDVQYWSDVGVPGAFFHTGGDAVTYLESPGGLQFESANTEEAIMAEGTAINDNDQYYGEPYSNPFTFTARFQVSSNDFPMAILANGVRDDDTTLWFGIVNDDGDGPYLQARMNVVGSPQYLIETPQISLSDEGFDEATLIHDPANSTAKISWNRRPNKVASDASVGFPSTPPAPSEPNAYLGSAAGTSNHFDGIIQGAIGYFEEDKETSSINWNKGNQFDPSLFLEDDLDTFEEFQNLPGSPVDKEKVFFNPIQAGKFLLEYDADRNEWICISTGGEYEEIPITKNGNVNTDLFTEFTGIYPPSVSVPSGTTIIRITHGEADTGQTWRADCGIGLRGGEVRMGADMNLSTIPSDGFPYAATYLGTAAKDASLNGQVIVSSNVGDYALAVREYNDSGSYVTDHARNNSVSGTDVHYIEDGATNQPFADQTEFYAQTTSSTGTVTTASDAFTTSPKASLEFGLESESQSTVSTTPSFDIHSLEIKV